MLALSRDQEIDVLVRVRERLRNAHAGLSERSKHLPLTRTLATADALGDLISDPVRTTPLDDDRNRPS